MQAFLTGVTVGMIPSIGILVWFDLARTQSPLSDIGSFCKQKYLPLLWTATSK